MKTRTCSIGVALSPSDLPIAPPRTLSLEHDEGELGAAPTAKHIQAGERRYDRRELVDAILRDFAAVDPANALRRVDGFRGAPLNELYASAGVVRSQVGPFVTSQDT